MRGKGYTSGSENAIEDVKAVTNVLSIKPKFHQSFNCLSEEEYAKLHNAPNLGNITKISNRYWREACDYIKEEGNHPKCDEYEKKKFKDATKRKLM